MNPYSRIGRIALLGIMGCALWADPGLASDWQPVDSTDDGIRIFKKETSSSLVEFRGVGIVKAPLPLVASIIFDTARRREWIDGLAERSTTKTRRSSRRFSATPRG